MVTVEPVFTEYVSDIISQLALTAKQCPDLIKSPNMRACVPAFSEDYASRGVAPGLV